MCGIAGFNWEDDGLLHRMARAIGHRGPDAVGVFSRHDHVSFASTRLSILDLHERSNQPLYYRHDGREYVLVFNGEIYNYRELRRELEQAGCRFQTESDSEVILAGYAVWGEDAVRRLNGMWAFAIYDDARRQLFLSRDRFGKKPLYYWKNDSRFIFGSEIKALLQSPMVSRVADRAMVSDFLNFGLASHTHGTFFRDVRQLPAGSNALMDLTAGTLRITKYYELPVDTGPATVDEIHDVLRSAVARRLISDVPVCLSLSGGVDSSSIAALVAELHNDRMVAFTTTSGGPQGDETANVSRLLEVYPQFELIKVPIDAENLSSTLQRIVYHMDEPFISDSPFVRWKIAQAIHQRGFKVSITGEGADELLGGYPIASPIYLLDLWRRGKVARLAGELASALLQPDRSWILREFLSRLLPRGDERMRAYLLQTTRQLGCRLEPTDSGAAILKRDVGLKEKLRSEVTTFFLPYLLCCNDKMYMAHSVEARAPMLDVEIAELFLRQATDNLIVRGIRKFPLRNAMRGRVPDQVLFDRRKIGFASPLHSQLARPDERAWVRTLFSDARSSAFIDSKAFLAAHDSAEPHGSAMDFLLRGVTLELWMREFAVSPN
jgi:asparagine synthase (glutamine-hydrolysing)